MRIKVEKATDPEMFKLDQKNMALLLEAAILLRQKFGNFILNEIGRTTISELIDNLENRLSKNREYGVISKRTIINLNNKWKRR